MNVKEAIRELLSDRGEVSAGEIATAAGVTRQAAHYHLAHMLAAGELLRVGAGRGSRYRVRTVFAETYPLRGLQEEDVWRGLESGVSALWSLPPNVRSIFRYALTEMVNNAIDHSRGKAVVVRLWLESGSLTFDVLDDGVGAFRTVREKFGLADDLEAIQELSKGKRTIDPEHHTGQGIFFTSKAVDVFRIQAGETGWTVDNTRQDQAVGRAANARRGTRVICSIDMSSQRVLSEVFDRYSDPRTLAFSKSRTLVRLFHPEGAFVSRSEAKRLAANLESFSEVELDFSGVEEVGQGFVDELFRVWAREHPGTKLVPINMVAHVAAMIRRGLQLG